MNNTSCGIKIIKHICFDEVRCNYHTIVINICTNRSPVLYTTVYMSVKCSQIV